MVSHQEGSGRKSEQSESESFCPRTFLLATMIPTKYILATLRECCLNVRKGPNTKMTSDGILVRVRPLDLAAGTVGHDWLSH